MFLTHAEPLLGERRLQGRLLLIDDALRIAASSERSARRPRSGGADGDGASDVEDASEQSEAPTRPDGASG